MAQAEAEKDERPDLFATRSVLFLPASNGRAIEKARRLGADLVILDLEDAVKVEDKIVARNAAVDAVAERWPMPVAIRVNAVGTQWHALDLEAVAGSNADYLVLPRANSAQSIDVVGATSGKPVLAMIETAAGVLAARDVAIRSSALIAGTNDLRSDLRLPLGAGRQPISTALQLIVLAARAARIAAFDGVFNTLDDVDGFLEEARESRLLGFDGKSLIHPDQIAPCHLAFAPSREEIDRARALVAAFRGGAERFGNEMIERMHVAAAERIIERSSN